MKQTESAVMDKNRIAGSVKEVTGAAKEAVGKVIGDAKLQSDGKAEKAIGKIQNAVGGVNDAVRDALKKP
jgi:uncharacterized protein YjbJ (UPF0337 family)